MNIPNFSPRALFLSADGTLYSDSLICSGMLPAQLGGKPCPFSVDKHMPQPKPLSTDDPDYDPSKGKPGDLCPPCAMRQIGALESWEEHDRFHFPEELLPLRLFQCRQAFWLIVPGLYDDEPTRFADDDDGDGGDGGHGGHGGDDGGDGGDGGDGDDGGDDDNSDGGGGDSGDGNGGSERLAIIAREDFTATMP